MISAFKHIRLSGYNLLPQSSNGNIRLSLNNSGVAYFSELTSASGVLNTKIDAFSGTFQSFVNNLDATYATDAQLTSLSGTLRENVVYTTGNQTIVGSKTFAASRYVFSGADVIFTNNTGIVSGEWRFSNRPTVNGTGVVLIGEAATPQNLASTGSTLNTRIDSLSGTLTGVVANLASTGSTLNTRIDGVVANLASTGSTLNTRIDSLSGTLTGDYVRKATQQQFIVTLPINVESTGILFPVVFASTPNSVQVTFEPFTDVAYMVAVKNRTITGFTAEFSDVLFETGNKLNVFASV